MEYAYHLDIVSVIPERVLKLACNCFDAIESEHYKRHNQHRPPVALIYHSKRQDTSKQRQDLPLVYQDGHGELREPYGLHAAEAINQGVELHRQLRRLRRVKPAPRMAPRDEGLDKKRQLHRQRQALVLVAPQLAGEQAVAVLVRRGVEGAPLGAQRVLDAVGHGHEDAGGALDVGALGGAQLRGGQAAAAGPAGAGEEGPHEVAHRGYHRGEVVAAVPEALVGRLVAEDEHQAHHDGERRHHARREAEVVLQPHVQGHDYCGEQRVEEDWQGDVPVDRSLDEAEHQRPSGVCSPSVCGSFFFSFFSLLTWTAWYLLGFL